LAVENESFQRPISLVCYSVKQSFGGVY
jgi:hypothetical protein